MNKLDDAMKEFNKQYADQDDELKMVDKVLHKL